MLDGRGAAAPCSAFDDRWVAEIEARPFSTPTSLRPCMICGGITSSRFGSVDSSDRRHSPRLPHGAERPNYSWKMVDLTGIEPVTS
jgi:hypothetical protein